jgi:hypothetical protein
MDAKAIPPIRRRDALRGLGDGLKDGTPFAPQATAFYTEGTMSPRQILREHPLLAPLDRKLESETHAPVSSTAASSLRERPWSPTLPAVPPRSSEVLFGPTSIGGPSA